MDWLEILGNIGLFIGASLKFLVGAPIIAAKYNFITGLIMNVAAGACGVSFFFFLSDYFMERAHKKRVRKIENGVAKPKRKFTRINKFLVKTKLGLGMIGIALITPTLISIPVGSLVMAKFFNHSKWAYPFLLLSVVFWALLIGGIASLFPNVFESIFPEANG